MKNIFFTCFLSLALAGCCMPQRTDPINQYKQKHPGEAKDYTYIYPVNLELYKGLVDFEFGRMAGIAGGLRARFGSTPGVNEFADKISKEQTREHEASSEHFQELEMASSNSGLICQYNWSDGKTREIGWLVIKSGEVIKRLPWQLDELSNDKADGNR